MINAQVSELYRDNVQMSDVMDAMLIHLENDEVNATL
jgi:hypothetical protein